MVMEEKFEYESIITHSDLDGVASAALCSWAFEVDRIVFTGPIEVQEAIITITERDIVCDLPLPLECAMWFDHHAGNFAELEYRAVDLPHLRGRFAEEKSCARVVLDYLNERFNDIPGHFAALVDAVDIVDSFDYKTVDQWRAETPAHIISNSMKPPSWDYKARNKYYRSLVYSLRNEGLEKTAELPGVRRRFAEFQGQEEKMLELLKHEAKTYSEESGIVLVDLTHHKKKPFVWKNLAQVLFPETKAVLAVESRFNHGKKTNDLSLSMSLTIHQNCMGNSKNIGEIMRTLNIGDGHPGAAGGRVYCKSKEEMLTKKKEIIDSIVNLWQGQQEMVAEAVLPV